LQLCQRTPEEFGVGARLQRAGQLSEIVRVLRMWRVQILVTFLVMSFIRMEEW